MRRPEKQARREARPEVSRQLRRRTRRVEAAVRLWMKRRTTTDSLRAHTMPPKTPRAVPLANTAGASVSPLNGNMRSMHEHRSGVGEGCHHQKVKVSWRRVGCTFRLRWRALMCVRLGPCQVCLVMYHRLVLYSALAIASPRVSPGRLVELAVGHGCAALPQRAGASELGAASSLQLPSLTALSLCGSPGSLRESIYRIFVSAKHLSDVHSATFTLLRAFGAFQKRCRCHTAGGRVRGPSRATTLDNATRERASGAHGNAQTAIQDVNTRRYTRDKRATGADRVRRAAHTASAPNHIPQCEAGYTWPSQTRPNFATSSPARSSQVWRRI